jgi:hypothetical protein
MSKLSWYAHRLVSLAIRNERRAAQVHWGTQREYNRRPDKADAIARSILVADWVKRLNPACKPVVELGCNTARNLAFVDVAYEKVVPRLIGVDVNKDALKRAKARNMRDFHAVSSSADDYVSQLTTAGAVITMSAIDHMADEEFDSLVRNLPKMALSLVMVELYTGAEEQPGPFKYSRNLASAFEDVGFETLNWAPLPVGQYDPVKSPLYLYIGRNTKPLQ